MDEFDTSLQDLLDWPSLSFSMLDVQQVPNLITRL